MGSFVFVFVWLFVWGLFLFQMEIIAAMELLDLFQGFLEV